VFIYLEKFTDQWDPLVSCSVAECRAPIGWPRRCRTHSGISHVRPLLCPKPTTSLSERRASVRASHRRCPAALRPSVSKATALTSHSPPRILRSRPPPLSSSPSPHVGRRHLQSQRRRAVRASLVQSHCCAVRDITASSSCR
jgi:hypothetical protein